MDRLLAIDIMDSLGHHTSSVFAKGDQGDFCAHLYISSKDEYSK